MSFAISLEHTKNKKWQDHREKQWKEICLHSFSADSTVEELAPYRDYFFYGDIDKAIHKTLFTDFRSLLFWSPANNLEDIQKLFVYYWIWFFSEEDNNKIYQVYGVNTPEEYLNSILLDIAGWTEHQSPELMAELLIWVFGEKYDENRIFPISLGNKNWQPKISVNTHTLAFYLLRGIREYLFSYNKNILASKYSYLVPFLLDVIKYIDPRIYTTKRLSKGVQLPFDKSDQRIVRWFIANLEGVVTKREIKKNNGEIPHNDIKVEKLLRDGLGEIVLPEEYHKLVEFVHKHDKDCLDHFDDD